MGDDRQQGRATPLDLVFEVRRRVFRWVAAVLLVGGGVTAWLLLR
jgi:hypothetical protein